MNLISRKITALILAFGLAAASLAACSPSPSAALPTLRVGVMYSADIVPFVIAKERKLDTQNGFTLDLKVFSSAKDRDAALQSGELDGVYTDLIGMCVYQNAGLALKITGSTDGDYQLVAGKDTGITTIEKAAGKSAAISQNTLIEYTFDYIMEESGLADGQVAKQLVPRIPDRLEMLRSGKTDLCLLPEPFATLALGGGAVSLGSANKSGLYPAVSAFTEAVLNEREGDVKALYKAYDAAVAYINSTPIAEYEALVIKGAGFPEELKGKIALPEYRKNALPPEGDVQKAIDWAVKKELCKQGLLPADLLYAFG